MSGDKPKDTRKRLRINVGMSAAEYAEICRKVPPGERSEWCRERIFMSANFRDPLFDVGARLMARVALVKRFKELLQAAQSTMTVGADAHTRVRSGADEGLSSTPHSHAEIRALIESGIALADELSREAQEVRRLIAAREESARRIAPVERRNVNS